MKLFKEWKLIPFLVGVTSFGKACGLSAPGVYVKVSKFGDWIIETLQRHGERATRFKFKPLVCANRYYDLREYKEDIKIVTNGFESRNWYKVYFSGSLGDLIVGFARQFPDDPASGNCSGTLIEPNVVITTAECVLDKGQVFFFNHQCFGIQMFISNYSARPTHIVLKNTNIIRIAKIIVHPSYNSSISPFYNNIAVVKLTSFTPILPFCGWYGDPRPNRYLFITGQELILNENTEGMQQQCY